jgi:hypothetical protein
MISHALNVVDLLERQTDHGLTTGIPMSELQLINEDLATLIQNLVKLGGSGSLTVKFNFKADSRDSVMVSVARSIKSPKPKLGSQPLYMSQHGNLYDEHPNQQKLDLQEVQNVRQII